MIYLGDSIKSNRAGKLVVSDIVSIEDLESAYIQWVADRLVSDDDTSTGNRIDRLAEAIGISSKTIYNYIRKGRIPNVSRRRGRR